MKKNYDRLSKLCIVRIPNSRQMYRGTIKYFGTSYTGKKKDIKVPGMKLYNIINDDGEKVPDQWFNISKAFAQVDPKIGDTLYFSASIISYSKLDKDGEEIPYARNYKLGYPKNVKKLISPVKRLETQSEE